MTIPELIEALRSTYLKGCVHIDGYLRYDFPFELDCKEAWIEFCEISEDLREYGYELHNELTIEHDCITGYISEIRKTNP